LFETFIWFGKLTDVQYIYIYTHIHTHCIHLWSSVKCVSSSGPVRTKAKHLASCSLDLACQISSKSLWGKSVASRGICFRLDGHNTNYILCKLQNLPWGLSGYFCCETQRLIIVNTTATVFFAVLVIFIWMSLQMWLRTQYYTFQIVW
jgi:hypothetical protein